MFAAVFSDAKGNLPPVLHSGPRSRNRRALWSRCGGVVAAGAINPMVVLGAAVAAVTVPVWAAMLLGRTPVRHLVPTESVVGPVWSPRFASALGDRESSGPDGGGRGAAGLGAASLLAGPLAYSITTVNNASGGTAFSTAGPRRPVAVFGAPPARWPRRSGAWGTARRGRASLPPGVNGFGRGPTCQSGAHLLPEKHQGVPSIWWR